MIIQETTLTSGTATCQDTQQDLILVHNAGATVTLTIALPATPINGQKVTVTSIGGITTLTISSALTIVAALTTLAVGGTGTWMYHSSSK